MSGLRYDLHLHSCLSPCGDADMTPANIAGMASLNGLHVAALTDHNTCLNCPAFFDACRAYGIVPIAGMELTTAEEIHMVCLFPSLEAAMEFDLFVSARRMKIPNHPEIFGEQVIVDSDDCPIGRVEELLVLATSLDLTTATREVRRFGGVPFPAHVDKQANSVIAVLGDLPAEPGFASVEFHDAARIADFRARYPALRGLRALVNSDAHMLESMPLEPSVLELPGTFDGEAHLRRAIVALLDE